MSSERPPEGTKPYKSFPQQEQIRQGTQSGNTIPLTNPQAKLVSLREAGTVVPEEPQPEAHSSFEEIMRGKNTPSLEHRPAYQETIPQTLSTQQLAEECRARIAGHGQDPGEQ